MSTMRALIRRLRAWMGQRRESRRHVPTDLADAIRDGIGTRITEGPPGLHSNLYDTVMPDHRDKDRPGRGDGASG